MIGASLGQNALRDGLIAGGAGLLFVMIFLVLFYGLLGLIADVALLIYGLLLAGIVLLIPVTMTLPGIAGTILTIGVAADANIVIFERIKEEVRVGKSIRTAIAIGYQKGFRTIVDANVVTLITAAILYISTTSSVKGFALMLLIGVITSIFTAVVATRAMLSLMAGFKFMSGKRVMGNLGTRRPVEEVRPDRQDAAVVRDLGDRHRDRRLQPRHPGPERGHRLHRRLQDRVHDPAGAHDR